MNPDAANRRADGTAPDDAERARTARLYDAMAADYSAANDDNAFNAHYERPATTALLGDVRGLRVLETGCGPGHLTRWLVDHGARVTAVDISPAMVELAKARVGRDATVLVADAAEGLPFAGDASADLVVSSLMLHYIRRWEPVLATFRRVLTSSGRVVLSTHHPFMDARLHSPENYFTVKQVTERWTKGANEYDVTFWRRPLTAMSDAMTSAGFVIEKLVEPEPAAELAERDPDAFRALSTQPTFLFFVLRTA